MSLQSHLKVLVENVPPSVGRTLTRVPFGFRLGRQYTKSRRDIARMEIQPSEIEVYQFTRLQRLLTHTYEKNEFYRDFYASKGFRPSDLKSPSDWNLVPIVTKADMQKVDMTDRITSGLRGLQVNTGGTSGQPLQFLLEKNAYAVEWAHMHHLWMSRGYRPDHLKLTLRGKHFETTRALKYNAVHNEYIANSNCSMEAIVDAVLRLPEYEVIRWIHGYPSLVAEFAYALESRNADATLFTSRLRGVLLGSEYPAPVYRNAIVSRLSNNIVSWYGHSEMALLAGERMDGIYQSLPTYGLAEAVKVSDQNNQERLICTSFSNFVHPFIRYDTGDIVESVGSQPGSLIFRVNEGRIGDFVITRSGHRLSLTAMIFGRHHSAFRLLRHVQVRDDGEGHVSLIVVKNTNDIDEMAIREGFDFSGLDIDWNIEFIEAPIRTSAGKIALKVRSSTVKSGTKS